MKGWRKFVFAALSLVAICILAWADKFTGAVAGSVSGLFTTFMASNAYEHKKEKE